MVIFLLLGIAGAALVGYFLLLTAWIVGVRAGYELCRLGSDVPAGLLRPPGPIERAMARIVEGP